MKKVLGISILVYGSVFTSAALAQDATGTVTTTTAGTDPAAGMAVQEVQPVAPAQPVPMQPVQSDGVRFRGGIAAAGGAEFASGFLVGMGGIEGRLGVQISNLIGIYVQPSLSFGAGEVNGGGGRTVFTGTFGVSALVDFTIEDYFFFGVGGGFGILNNPVGAEIHVRLGAYPVFWRGDDGYSRGGLMVGVDARTFLLFAGSQVLPVGQIMASIGYEVF
jgi:hypothetical protein